jgi:hypothetical protein
MKSFVFLAGVLALLPAFSQQKPKKPEPAIEMTEVVAKREDPRLTIDGRLKNTGDRAAKKLVIIFEVLDGDKNVLTRQTGGVDGDDLDPGAEAEFHNQMHFHARAVSVRFAFEEGNGREIRAVNTGPFLID